MSMELKAAMEKVATDVGRAVKFGQQQWQKGMELQHTKGSIKNLTQALEKAMKEVYVHFVGFGCFIVKQPLLS
jgi:hypothetical protein